MDTSVAPPGSADVTSSASPAGNWTMTFDTTVWTTPSGYYAIELKNLTTGETRYIRGDIQFQQGILNGAVPVSGGAGAIAAPLAASSITTTLLNNLAVTDAKINDVAASKITGTLATAQYANASVTAAKVAADVATQAELDAHAADSSDPHGATLTQTRVLVGDGTAALPSVAAISDPDTGIYWLTGSDLLSLAAGGALILQVAKIGGVEKIGFFGAAGVGKQNVTGSRGGNAALTSLLAALAQHNLINDNSTA